jgi:UDP-N-acetyl-D-mannosaminuronic acid transferase (WecB/TagA/CpsF family)
MVCISELRGLQNFQARHPETIVVAMNVLEHEHAQDAIDRLIKKQKLDMLHVAQGKEWQDKFRLQGKFQLRCLSTVARSA